MEINESGTRPDPTEAVEVTVFAQGRPLAGVEVEGGYSIGLLRSFKVSGRTDGGGKVSLRMPAGVCCLQVHAPGYAVDTWGAKAPGKKRIDLEPAGKISLRVITEDGRPVEKASIQVYGATGRPPVWEPDPGHEAGIYVFDGLYRRPHLVLVRAPSLQGVRLADVSPGEIVRDIVLRKGKTLSGRVVDASGKAVKGAGVRAMDPATPPIFGRTDADGRFTLQGVGEGPITVDAFGPLLLRHTIEGVKPGAEEIVVQLAPGGDIEIRFEGEVIPAEVEIGLQARSETDGLMILRGGYDLSVKDRRVNLGAMDGLSWGTYAFELLAEGCEPVTVDQVHVLPEAPVAAIHLVLRRAVER